MIDDSNSKQFDYVIVWKLDRFARNRYDSAIYKNKLRKNNVRVLSAMENIGEGDESIILEAVLEASAEYFSRDLSKKVKRGMRETAMKGNFTGGRPAYGYKIINQRYVADESQAPAVIYANTEYAKGTIPARIIDHLNRRGYKNNVGKPINHNFLHTILGNPKHIGIYKYGDIEIENVIPALYDRETYDNVLERKSKNKRYAASRKSNVDYALRGKVFCGICGSTMLGDCGRGRNGMHYYYACSARKKRNECKKKSEKKDFLEWYVVEQTLLYVLAPDRIEYIAKRVVEKHNLEFNDDNIKALENRIAKIDREIGQCIDTIIKSSVRTIITRIETHVQELESLRIELEVDLSKLRIASKTRYKESDIITWIKSFCKGDLMDEEFRQRIIDVFINAVYVFDDKIIVYYNIKGGKQISYIEMLDNTQECDCHDAPQSSTRFEYHSPRYTSHKNRTTAVFSFVQTLYSGFLFQILIWKLHQFASKKHTFRNKCNTKKAHCLQLVVSSFFQPILTHVCITFVFSHGSC